MRQRNVKFRTSVNLKMIANTLPKPACVDESETLKSSVPAAWAVLHEYPHRSISAKSKGANARARTFGESSPKMLLSQWKQLSVKTVNWGNWRSLKTSVFHMLLSGVCGLAVRGAVLGFNFAPCSSCIFVSLPLWKSNEIQCSWKIKRNPIRTLQITDLCQTY
jgi:hypothetical protein